jgi:hypothetical protein
MCRRGIHFLLDLLPRLPNSTNISLSCGCVVRYIFGGLQAIAQMAIDKHAAETAVERVGDDEDTENKSRPQCSLIRSAVCFLRYTS